jgi:hypothetical protein
LYKWVDEKGATHYSDRKPDDEKTAKKVKSVDGATVSVYTPDKTLLKAVERAREKASREPAPEPERIARPYAAPVSPQPPYDYDPCAAGSPDCGYYAYAPAYASQPPRTRFSTGSLPGRRDCGHGQQPRHHSRQFRHDAHRHRRPPRASPAVLRAARQASTTRARATALGSAERSTVLASSARLSGRARVRFDPRCASSRRSRDAF